MAEKNEPDVDAVAEVASKAVKATASGVATFESLVRKPRRVLSFTVTSADEDANPIILSLKYKALSSREYDDLIAAHPPTDKDKRAGQVTNVATFAPALIAAVSAVPHLNADQAKELYNSESWSGGERDALYINALRVCNSGLDVPFNAQD